MKKAVKKAPKAVKKIKHLTNKARGKK
jgi:hypothetical protein